MRKLLANASGCWSKGERFDPTYEKRLKTRQAEKHSESEATRATTTDDESYDRSAPVSQREAKKRRKGHLATEER